MDILSELTAVKADFVAAQNLLEEAKTSFDSLKAEAQEKNAALQAAITLVADKEATLADLTAALGEKSNAYAALQAELAELKASQKSAEAKAVEIVANAGIKPIKASHSAEAASVDRSEVIANINAIKDPVERAKFYFANKAVLFGN